MDESQSDSKLLLHFTSDTLPSFDRYIDILIALWINQVSSDVDHNLRVLFLPETYYVYSLLWFYLFFAVTMTTTALFSKEYKDPITRRQNPITLRDGYNFICIAWDYEPVTFFSVPLFLPFCALFLFYTVLDVLRLRSLVKNKKVTPGHYKLYRTFAVLMVVSLWLMPETMAVEPGPGKVHLLFHSVPYLLLLVGLWLANMMNIFYYHKSGLFETKRALNECKCLSVGFLKTYAFVVTFILVYKFVWSTINLIGMMAEDGSPLSKLHISQEPWVQQHIIPFGHFNEYLFMLVVTVLPLPLKLWMAPLLHNNFVEFHMSMKTKDP